MMLLCFVSLPTVAASPLCDAWGLHPPSRVGTRNQPALGLCSGILDT